MVPSAPFRLAEETDDEEYPPETAAEEEDQDDGDHDAGNTNCKPTAATHSIKVMIML